MEDTCAFFACSSTILDSIEFSMTSLVILTGLVWPIRCTRSPDCHSTAGLYHGSMMNTWLASVKFNATPPALRDTRKTVISGSSENRLMVAARAAGVMCPSNLTQLNPALRIRHWIRSRKLVNWENTIDYRQIWKGQRYTLIVQSRERSFHNSSTSASILVEDRQVDISIRFTILPFLKAPSSTTSSPGAERSMFNTTLQTGQMGFISGLDWIYSSTHNRQKTWWHLDRMASCASSSQIRQTNVPSPSFWCRLSTRSGWSAICRIRVISWKMLA